MYLAAVANQQAKRINQAKKVKKKAATKDRLKASSGSRMSPEMW